MKVFDYLVDELKNYVRKEEFEPVKALVFGMTAIILTAVVGALITLVIRN